MNESLLYGIVSKPEHVNIEELKDFIKKDQSAKDQEEFEKKFIIKKGITVSKGK